MSEKNSKFLEIFLYIIALALIICCMAALPAWIIVIIKLVICGVLAYGAYQALMKKQTVRTLVLFILALLFQPFYTIPVGQVIWTCIKIGVIIYLLYLLYSVISDSIKKENRR